MNWTLYPRKAVYNTMREITILNLIYYFLGLCTLICVLFVRPSTGGVPICTADNMGDNPFCFPPDYNKVRKLAVTPLETSRRTWSVFSIFSNFFIRRAFFLWAIYLRWMMVPSIKIVISFSRTWEKLNCKGEQYWFSG